MAPRRASIAGPAPTRLRWARRRPRRACHAHLARTRRRGRALPTSACAMSALLAAMAGLVESAWPERTNLHLARQHAPSAVLASTRLLPAQRQMSACSAVSTVQLFRPEAVAPTPVYAMPGTLEPQAYAPSAARVTTNRRSVRQPVPSVRKTRGRLL